MGYTNAGIIDRHRNRINRMRRNYRKRNSVFIWIITGTVIAAIIGLYLFTGR